MAFILPKRSLVCLGLPALAVCVGGASNLAAAPAQNGEARKVVRVARVDSAPVIDGRLDDAVWAQAGVITDFHQIRPGDGTPPSEPTAVYLVYTDDALYIGARMYDSEPDRIAAPTMRHGQGLGDDDRLVVILDPFNTGRGGYRFETNANGVRHDALYENVSSFQSEWTVIWDAAASIFDGGWMAELEIPFKTLPFDPSIDTWGFNFGRGIRRRGEEMAWVSRNRSYNPSILGLAAGLEGMDQGYGIDIVPSVTINRLKTFRDSRTEAHLEPSLDIFYRVTPSLNASLTVNTDFSAAEVDDRQVNLTRFNLFFPEKRDFFLNDADLFEFGRIGTETSQAASTASDNNARPFFSRRLGLSATGVPVDLARGGKLSGRIGRFNIGALAVEQDAFGPLPSSGAFVGRVSANVLAESTAGVIVTAGDPNSNRDNSLLGFDFRYLNTRIPGGRVLEADAWYQRTETDGLEGDDAALGLGVRMPNNAGWRGGLNVKRVGTHFNPALGFVSRTGVQDLTADAGYTHFAGGGFVQSVFTGVDFERITYLDGGLQSQIVLARLAEVRSNTGERFRLRYSATREVVAQAFTIFEDASRAVVVPPGEYRFGETEVQAETGGQRPVSGRVTYRRGGFFGGTRWNVGGELAWRPSRRFNVTFRYDLNDIDLPGGGFITRLMRVTTEMNFSSNLSWINLVQYDNASEVLGVNARLRWIPEAGQEALIVLNHTLEDPDNDNVFQSRLADVSVKLAYTFRF